MAEFWVGMKGDLAAEQMEALTSAGIAVDDLRRTLSGRGIPIQWETMRTFVRVSAVDEPEARGKVARTLGLESGDLLTYPPEIF
jgi:hypothetical protein